MDLFFFVSNGLKHLEMNFSEGARALHAAVLHFESPSCIYVCPQTFILTVSRMAWESFSNQSWAPLPPPPPPPKKEFCIKIKHVNPSQQKGSHVQLAGVYFPGGCFCGMDPN